MLLQCSHIVTYRKIHHGQDSFSDIVSYGLQFYDIQITRCKKGYHLVFLVWSLLSSLNYLLMQGRNKTFAIGGGTTRNQLKYWCDYGRNRRTQGGLGGEAPSYWPAGGSGGAVSPPTGSRGGAPGSYWFLEHLEVFEEVLEDKMSEFLRSKM